MKPSDAIKTKRMAVRQATERFNATNPRLFGSTVHGTDTEDSDLDVLVDPLPSTTLIDLGGLLEELEAILGVRVDLRTPGDLPPTIRARVLAEATPV